MTNKKKFIIQATVQNSRFHTPEEEVKDMLRYDNGTIIHKNTLEKTTILTIKSEFYTPARWNSFIIPTKLIRKEY